jgi:hypothetical protein
MKCSKPLYINARKIAIRLFYARQLSLLLIKLLPLLLILSPSMVKIENSMRGRLNG